MATIRERKGKKGVSYMAEVRLKGYPPQTASFSRITDAKKWVQQTEAAIREGRHFKTSEAKKRTLEELIDRYIEDRLPHRGEDKETVGPQLLWWKKQLGKYSLADITPVLIAECRDRLLKEPGKNGRNLSNATVIRYLASLSVCYSYGIEDLGWVESNPVKDVRKPKPERGRVRFLTEEEREALLVACRESSSPYLYTVVVLALSTGARMAEIMGLTWKDLDFKRRMIRLEKTKNGERRSVPLTGKAYDLLEGMSKVRRIDTPYVFPREDGKKPIDIRKQWEKAVEKAKLEDFRFHDLRHTAASYLAMDGASLLQIADILGHKTMAMVKRYSHLAEGHTAEVLERVNRKHFGDG